VPPENGVITMRDLRDHDGDLRDHDGDLRDHDAAICVITMRRYTQ
jgi:hypothetical protein